MAQAKEKPLYPAPADIEDDFYLWCLQQAETLRQKRFAEADLPNIIEELESMGRRERLALESSYRLLILHLLKWQFQPDRRSSSWEITIIRERDNIEAAERTHPSLRHEAQRFVEVVYPAAARAVSKETHLAREIFPAECPYSLDFLRDHDRMPD